MSLPLSPHPPERAPDDEDRSMRSPVGWILGAVWGTALGNVALALTAPVRPWGWQGGGMLVSAAGTGLLAAVVSRGRWARWMLLPALVVAVALVLVVRVVMPAADAGAP